MADSHVLGVLASIKLDKRCVIAAIEAWMFSGAELVVFPDDWVQLGAEGPEDDRELLLLFLQVHESAEERWYHEVLAFTEENCVHFLLELLGFKLCLGLWVKFF